MGGSQYSRVCRRALAYQFGLQVGFYRYHDNRRGLNAQYVDDLSLTHAAPGSRQHIWTFSSGLFTRGHTNSWPTYKCPCDDGNTTYPSPPFVGNVRLHEQQIIGICTVFFQMLNSGMVRFVRVVAHAASSTIHHGLLRT